MTSEPEEIPLAWQELDLSKLSGILMVAGPPDVGKSTFSRYLFKQLCKVWHPIAYLDGDPGQSTLGPPGTMTLALAEKGDDIFPPRGRRWRSFIGSVSPARHMLQILTGAARLAGAAREAGAQAVIFDTTGLVDPARGGLYLKLAKIDLLRPKFLFAIQRDRELESLLVPLRRSRRLHIVDLTPGSLAQRRDILSRKARRAAKFARYFAEGAPLRLNWPHFAVFPAPHFELHRLVAMEGLDGYTIGLGIVVKIDRIYRQVILHTPVDSLDKVDAIRLGNKKLDPQTYEDWPLSRKG